MAEQNIQTEQTAQNTAQTVTPPALQNTSWRLTRLDGQAVEVERPPTLNFDAERQRVTGFGGCNQFFGGYALGPDGALEIANVGSTKMLCPGTEQLEQRYLAALRDATRLDRDDRRLRLSHPAGELVFEADNR